MKDKKFSSKKYNDYPVIIDNERNVELTLDSTVEILNDYEWMREYDIKEHNALHKAVNHAVSEKRAVESERNNLIHLIIFMGVIILIETLWIIRGG